MTERRISQHKALAWLAAAVWTWSAQAADPIYRCEAQNGALVFQDQPCNLTPGTREARNGSAGIRVIEAPPPAEAGAVVQERYRRYLEQVERDRREQASADAAAAARLRAELAADAAAAASAPTERADPCVDPYYIDSDARCGRISGGAYPVYVPVLVQPPRPVQRRRHPPELMPPVDRAPPSRPPPRVPRDVRSEILDTRR